MRKIIFILALAVSLQNCQEEKKSYISENFEVVELGPGIFSCIHKIGGKAICNVGIVDNGRETVIFDSFLSPVVAQEIGKVVKAMELSPIKYVVNSHFHNDHIRGNQVFPDEVKVVSTTRTRELIEEEEPLQIAFEKENAPARFEFYDSLYQSFKGDHNTREYQQILMWRPYYEVLTRSHEQVRTRLPNVLVDSVLKLDGPDRSILLISKGAGHTESDLVLYLPEDQVLFSGDLLFNECHPYVAHGYIPGWKAWLLYLKTLGVERVMPGHGQIGTVALFDDMYAYLTDLEKAAGQIYNNDLSIDDKANYSIPERYEAWWFDRFYEYNLRFAYGSLREEGLD